MKIPNRGIGHIATLAVVAFAISAQARAEETYPSKPLRLVVPYPPGAVTDSVSRIVAAELGQLLGQSVIVENRPGGGTVIGTQSVKQSPADGYSILYQSNAMVTNLVALKQPGYKLSDFAAVGASGNSAYLMALSTKHPFKSLNEFVTYAKAHPGKLNYSSTGIASAASIIGFKLGKAAALDWIEIPFKGGAEATNSVMAGDSDVFFGSQGAPLLHSNPDKLRILGITSEKRSPLLPNIPTLKELGYPSVIYQSWSAFFVRSDTPDAIQTKLKKAFADMKASANLKSKLEALNVPLYEGSLKDLQDQIDKEYREVTTDAASLGIRSQ